MCVVHPYSNDVLPLDMLSVDFKGNAEQLMALVQIPWDIVRKI